MILEAEGAIFERFHYPHPKLVMSSAFQKGHSFWKDLGHANVNPYLPIHFETSDPRYIGSVASVSGEVFDLRRNNQFTDLLGFTFLDAVKRKLAVIDMRGDKKITVYNPLLTPKNIADTVESVKVALQDGNASEYKVPSLYQIVEIGHAIDMNVPEDQYVRDNNGAIVVDRDRNEVKIISGSFLHLRRTDS